MEIKPVAYFRSPLPEKFGTPRQAGLAPSVPGEVRLAEGISPEVLDGLDGFERIWLIWEFSLNKGECSPKVRPPRLGGNRRIGVFATRSPYRPNPLGLSTVKIASVDAAKGLIRVLGADLVDGTPIYDIKPYIPYADSHPDARAGFVDEKAWEPLEVLIPEDIPGYGMLEEEDLRALRELLSLDPRPQYQDDPSREYGLGYKKINVRFRVEGRTLTVTSVDR